MRPVKIADCKRGEANDIIYQRKKFSWKTTIRQRLNARVLSLIHICCDFGLILAIRKNRHNSGDEAHDGYSKDRL